MEAASSRTARAHHSVPLKQPKFVGVTMGMVSSPDMRRWRGNRRGAVFGEPCYRYESVLGFKPQWEYPNGVNVVGTRCDGWRMDVARAHTASGL